MQTYYRYKYAQIGNEYKTTVVGASDFDSFEACFGYIIRDLEYSKHYTLVITEYTTYKDENGWDCEKTLWNTTYTVATSTLGTLFKIAGS